MIITKEIYEQLPGNGAAAILNGIGADGQPILKYAKFKYKNGDLGIEKYWVNDGKSLRMQRRFIIDMEY